MSQIPIQVTDEQVRNAEALLATNDAEIAELRNQLIQGESQFQNAAEEHQEILAKLELLNSKFESEVKKNTELTLQMTSMENIMLKRELEFANMKAELLQKFNTLQSEGKVFISESDSSASAIKAISRLPVFEGKTIAFIRWINGVTEILDNYPALKDFQKRALTSNDYAVSTAQNSSSNRRIQPQSYFQRNPFKRSTQPHSRENTTMTKEQYDEYVKSCVCFNCGAKGHLRSSCLRPRRTFRTMDVAIADDSGKDEAQ
ncbi:hypothetical protein AYI69_g1738 [Smittium culicis]|uniref:CCHC-type domain-containing protein n=1 Tax=Smittium culicis TaxID=133412 RepID=A0A1R1YPK8_9FUNG|nr:hypothetical protein AYI69_g1738 [Smittium culicis]